LEGNSLLYIGMLQSSKFHGLHHVCLLTLLILWLLTITMSNIHHQVSWKYNHCSKISMFHSSLSWETLMCSVPTVLSFPKYHFFWMALLTQPWYAFKVHPYFL
jgi:hypothetical protein